MYLKSELGEGTLRVMKTLKNALDPRGIMNPGKVSRAQATANNCSFTPMIEVEFTYAYHRINIDPFLDRTFRSSAGPDCVADLCHLRKRYSHRLIADPAIPWA